MSAQATILPAITHPISSAILSHHLKQPAFQPRQVFEVTQSLTRSYFLGHHRAGLNRMRRSLANIGLIIECRDFRVPATSWNPLLENALSVGSGGRQRIIVYTKRDLGPTNQEGGAKIIDRLMAFHRKQGDTFIGDVDALGDTGRNPSASSVIFMGNGFTNERGTAKLAGEKKLLAAVRAAAANHESMTGLRALVVGMPNTGKSTLLNKLRARGMGLGKAARTGGQPGATRKLSTPVRVLPPVPVENSSLELAETTNPKVQTDPLQQGVFVMDTPGVFVPYTPDAESMLKLSLVGCVKDGIVSNITLADYLLFHINLKQQYDLYVPRFLPQPTNDVDVFLKAIAKRNGMLLKGGELSVERASNWIIKEWRDGRLGRFVLDEIDAVSMQEAKRLSLNSPMSLSQARKRDKEMRVAKATAK